jgi:serine protease DegQ
MTSALPLMFPRLGLAALLGIGPFQSTPAALPPEVGGQALPSLAPMLEHVTPAVVNVSSKTKVRVHDPFLDDPFFRRFFGAPNAPQERVQQSLGSGVIVDAAKGYILTNNHVVEGADDISVTLADGRTTKAERVGADADTDVAVIRIEAKNLVALTLADSSKLRVGDFVVAVGDPFGLGQTVTSGIVSALGRTGLKGLGYQNFIQTDASINPGNSGGALVNLRGELVGINSAIYSPSGGNVGIGFAIPTNLAGDVMRQLLATGSVKRGSLGVQTQALDEEIAPLLGMSPGRGAVVTRVLSNSPAAQAGIRPGDVITELNGRPIASPTDLSNAEGLLPVGSTLALKLLRDGETVSIDATLRAQDIRSNAGEKLDARLAGAEFTDVPSRLAQRGIAGVVASKITANSRAAANGLQTGDIVTAVNQREIEDLAAFEATVGKHPRQLLLTVVRGRGAFFLLIE